MKIDYWECDACGRKTEHADTVEITSYRYGCKEIDLCKHCFNEKAFILRDLFEKVKGGR